MIPTMVGPRAPASRLPDDRPRVMRNGAGFVLLLCLACTSCAGAAAVPPGGPVDPDARDPVSAGGGARPSHTAADIEFMRGMIAHHRQALDMTALVPSRTRTEAIHLLAERIEVSQTDEIAQMSRWLESHGEQVPAADSHAGHQGHDGLMPGMLSEQQMAELAAAQGDAFDRRFLELMIRHHEGALVMVGQLLASPGAAQDVDVYRIASEVDSDQRIEIERMRRMLATSA
jgi:uncharacterized protein (DUF305 family)